MSVHSPPRLLNFYFNEVSDSDSAFHSNADPDPASKNNSVPDLQPSLHYHEGMQFLFLANGEKG